MQHLQRLSKSWGLVAALRQLAGTPGSACEASAAAAARWNSSAAVSGAAGAAAEAAEAAAPSRMVPFQANKAALRSAASGRKAFDRAWAKNLQIKWDAKTRKAQQAAARKRQHEKRLEQFKQRAAWAAEAARA